MLTLDSIRKTQAKGSEILLAPSASMTSAGSSPMRVHCERRRAQIARHGWCTRKTAGKPVLSAIPSSHTRREQAGEAFDARIRSAVALTSQRIEGQLQPTRGGANDFAKLKRLPGPTQQAMTLRACLGNLAEAQTLAIVGSSIGRPVGRGALESGAGRIRHARRWDVQVHHDRIQEAAYSLIPADSQTQTHLRIGRLLLPASRCGARTCSRRQPLTAQWILSPTSRAGSRSFVDVLAGKKAKAAIAYVSPHYLATRRAHAP